MVNAYDRRTKKQKYESCVMQVKGQKGYNPYAVCRSSVFGKNKFNKYDLNKGTKVEMEHTKKKKVAQKIAKDHLIENPKYYDNFDLRRHTKERLVN